MKRILFPISVFASVVLVGAQNATRVEPGIVQGVVTRAGTNEGLSEIQVSLEGAVSTEACNRF